MIFKKLTQRWGPRKPDTFCEVLKTEMKKKLADPIPSEARSIRRLEQWRENRRLKYFFSFRGYQVSNFHC